MIALDNGFDEATAIVLDLDASIERLCRVFGYTLVWRGDADPGACALMGIAEGWTGHEALLGDPAQERGFIRLFDFPGRELGVMRDGAQPWDAGGVFDINIRALGPLEALHARMTRAGFCAFGPLTAWEFGPLSVKEVVSRDADGLAIATMQRVAPPLEGYENASGDTSYVFNSTQVVPDFDAAKAFFVDALGWQIVMESAWTHEGGRNCLGLPIDLARTRELRVGIYQSNGLNEGSVEILCYGGEALDFSAAPIGRGWAALRFPMRDVEGFMARAEAGGCTIVAPRRITVAPYGEAVAGVAITPWGARLEAYCL
ncbi:VOC family protein [Glacieibacterium frigidum]|uniref:VOC domain-containing protein n=1 Tax=Glacieibacterium frigidum TaxID=2593303 RepID=A0A552U8A5_9SPHN|nr:hypothetical protein [Glacieibacterium frigidum]TRW14447.1 hypothetical protein FMM06_12120 [Glacieibacterium frigidum]